MNKKFFLFSAFCFFPFLLTAQFDFNNKCIAAYQEILSLRFTEAGQILEQQKKFFPENRIPVYLENYLDFFQLFITEDRALFEKYMKNFGQRKNFIEKADGNDPYQNYFLGNMHLQSALLKIKFGETRSAAFEFNHSNKRFQENENQFPAFLPNKAGSGLLHVLAGMIPENFSWLLKIVGMEGDVQQGLKEISEVANYSGNDELYLIFRFEALFYLSFADVGLASGQQNALNILNDFEKNKPEFPPPDNPVWIFIKATILSKAHKNDEVIKTLSLYTPDEHHFRFTYLDYLTGVAKLNRLDPSADRYFIRFLKDFRGRNFIKSAYQKLGWYCLINGNQDKYREYLSLALTRGYGNSETDRQAQFEARKAVPPNPYLLKARLLFDGGYYDKALDQLLNVPVKDIVKSKTDLVEYNYRLGRIYHESGNTQKATFYYEKTIEDGRALSSYYAANAALQAGIIFERNRDFRNAEKYFRMCLDMEHEEYKNSLDQKARAGLRRISGNSH